jgi:SAM-dependent methyltransferase
MTPSEPHGSPRPDSHTLTTAEAKAFYDRFGAKQDTQAFYEDHALDALIVHADFQHAHAIFEFGCGTGRLAARLFETKLPEDCRYFGVDISETMVALARERLRRWANRSDIALSEAVIPLHGTVEAYDRFLSTYVLDLMSADAMQAVLGDAQRILRPEGLLCLVSLTHGHTLLTRLVSSAWTMLHRWNPKLVGGCRPIELRDFLSGDCWRVRHQEVVPAWGITSEVLIASRRAS